MTPELATACVAFGLAVIVGSVGCASRDVPPRRRIDSPTRVENVRHASRSQGRWLRTER
jgi:hypothetical protein